MSSKDQKSITKEREELDNNTVQMSAGIENKTQETGTGAGISSNITTQASNEGLNKPSFRQRVQDHAVSVVLGAIVVGFLAGIGGYQSAVQMTNREIVVKGCCIPKNQLVGPIVRDVAVREIDNFIKTGEMIGKNPNKVKDTEDTVIWLMSVLAFIQTIELPKDVDWQGQKMSAVEADIRYALLDPSVEVQRQKTLGILQGFRAALQTRVSNL